MPTLSSVTPTVFAKSSLIFIAKYMLNRLVIFCTRLIHFFLVSPSVVVQPQLIGIPVGKIFLIYYGLGKNEMSH